MSSTTDSPNDTDHTPWNELTTARRRVALTTAYVHGPATFERPNLLEQTQETDDLDTVIDDVDRVLTSLQYTTLLNELVTDGYLHQEKQGGKNPILLDLDYEEDRDDYETAPYGYLSRLHSVVDQILDREDLRRADLEVDDEDDFNEMRDAVNRTVGHTVLVTVADASQYRFTETTYGLVQSKTEA
ncbi:hypothetical protein [Halococcus salsus]|jgi:hypothetical protein|uniref:hypothetical protein n=1 Tax=Halococcus salsus TaxID=2162894 RepID=UPI0018657AE7|nr:hypothetical protein [Halococcus salsus]